MDFAATLEQRISEHYKALQAFHPDATPVSDRLLEGISHSIKSHQRHDRHLAYLLTKLEELKSATKGQLQRADGNAEEVERVLDAITPVVALDSITSEKGESAGRFAAWPKGSLFRLLDSGMRAGKTQSPFERFPNLVCDDGMAEVADFIGWDETEPRIVFVHAKCVRGRVFSVSALQDLCSQLVKCLVFLQHGMNALPEPVAKWNLPWSLGAHVVESRIRAGGKTAAQARTNFIDLSGNSGTRREAWMVLGGGACSKGFLRSRVIDPRARQAVHLMKSTMKACQSVGVVMRLFCSP